MIKLSSLPFLFLSVFVLLWRDATGQMLGAYSPTNQLGRRQDDGTDNNNNQNNGGFNIVNGRVFTPGLGIILAPQPNTPMGGDFLHIAIDVSGDGKLPVPPNDMSDPLTQVYNFTMFLTSIPQQKNFTISNITTTTPPLANIMNQEQGQTVKHINYEWPDCLVGDGQDEDGSTARGDYNITIHQNFRLNGTNHYTIFNLPISVTNSISQFPGANQLLTKPPPGPLNANGGRMSCDALNNQMISFGDLVESVNNPPGQPYQDIAIETSEREGGGTIGDPGESNPNGDPDGQIGNEQGNAQGALGAATSFKSASGRHVEVILVAAVTAFGVSLGW